MFQPRHLLTKSGYLSGLQCDKLLWIYQNDRSRIPEPGEAQQAIFDQGHKVGELARTLFAGGIEIDWSESREAGVARSHALLAERKPLYDRLRPYEQVPFQYSLHVVERPGHRGRHESFLADGSTDPRPEILSRLKTKLGRVGSIIAYNARFEIRALESCAGYFPAFAGWFKSIRPRFVDLYEPFRVFDYYHPDQQGSASLKAVLPVLTRRSYEGFRIADGATASARFLDMAFGNLAEAEKEAIRVDLETYCQQDTEGMLDIVQSIARIPADRSSESVSPKA